MFRASCWRSSPAACSSPSSPSPPWSGIPAGGGAVREARMEQIAFRMMLNPGQAEEYRRRHDAIWPELVALLHEAGISDYSIFLDPETDALFAVLRRRRGHGMDALPRHEVMRRWWTFM